MKLAAELARPDTGRTLYVLDEPTTGLHFDDIAKLLDVLHRLVDLGNTVLVIEHNLDVIKQCDWIIDIGPEAGAGGGNVVAMGTPEQVAEQMADVGSKIADVGKKRRKTKATDSPTSAIKHQTSNISHTALALAPILAAGPHVERKPYDFAAAEKRRKDDLDINQLGADVKMPWETNGRKWHVEDRTARSGAPVRWDGQILAAIDERVHAEVGDDFFLPTDWSHGTIVEINGPKKSDGWFFHAITGEPWVLKLKFRTAKRTFNAERLNTELNLAPFNDIAEVETYGNGPRVKCKNLRGPFQEVQVFAHSWEEIDTPAFWSMVDTAAEGFKKFTQRAATNPEDVMPCKVLGRKWHLSRKGFPPGKKVTWPQETLEELLELLESIASKASRGVNPPGPGATSNAPQFLWNNQQVINLMIRGQRTPWATIQTKRTVGVDLSLHGPAGAFATGRIANLGVKRLVQPASNGFDAVKLRFVNPGDLALGDLATFLAEHLAAVQNSAPEAAAS